MLREESAHSQGPGHYGRPGWPLMVFILGPGESLPSGVHGGKESAPHCFCNTLGLI